MPTIDIKIETQNWQPYEKVLYDHIDYLWHTLKLEAGEVSILLSDDTQLCTLNKHYRGYDKPTNILSFPALDLTAPFNAPDNKQDYLVLGDMALSYTRILAEAEAAGLGFEARALHLATHGFLHLLGYTHNDTADAALMEKREAELLAPRGIADPYCVEDNTANLMPKS